MNFNNNNLLNQTYMNNMQNLNMFNRGQMNNLNQLQMMNMYQTMNNLKKMQESKILSKINEFFTCLLFLRWQHFLQSVI